MDATQYRESPLGREKEKKVIIRGIIHSIIWLVWACRGSAEGSVVVFCTAHMDIPTRTGRMGVPSGRARFSQRNWLSRGTAWFTRGSQEYSFWESPTRDSGLAGSVWMMAWYRPIHMGI